MIFKRSILLYTVITSCILTLIGCATMPVRESFPIYDLNGINYIPLISYCNARSLQLKYDTFSGKVTINNKDHTIELRVYDDIALVDRSPQNLRHPVQIHNGTVVVPYSFKEQVLDNLFKTIQITPGRFNLASKIKRVVVDAGHGGKDPGAIGKSGLREKDVNLDIARRLANLLKSEGVDVVMTRSSDRFISLQSRVDIANSSKADLFISIHSNANRARSLEGFEAYYVSSGVSDTKRALASAKSAALNPADYHMLSNSLNLKATVWDLIYTNSRAESSVLASSICSSMRLRIDGIRVIGTKSAGFYVLKGARIPAVLLEVGFVSNYAEERNLKSAYYRQKIADAIVIGIKDYSKDIVLAEAD